MKSNILAYKGRKLAIEWYFNERGKYEKNLEKCLSEKKKELSKHDWILLLDTMRNDIMTKKIKSTVEEFIESLTPQEKKEYQEEYRDLVISELILAAMEEDEISVRQLAKTANISPTVIQGIRSGTKKNLSTDSFFKIVKGLGYTVILEKKGQIIPIDFSDSTRRRGRH